MRDNNPPPKGPWEWWSPAAMGQPPRKSHHTLTAVDWRPELVLAVGGWDGFRRVPHVHALDTSTWAWSAVRPVGDTPVGVSDHACASLPSGSILVLGRAAGGQAEWTDKWELSCEAAADGPGLVAEWTCLTKNGGSLAARTGHSLTLCAGADGARRLLVLGGRATPMVESLHTGAADDAAGGGALWSSLEEPLGGAAAPPARAAPAAAVPAFEGMARNFPCHGSDARPIAIRLFYSRLLLANSRRTPRMQPAAARRHHVAVSVGDEWVLLHGGRSLTCRRRRRWSARSSCSTRRRCGGSSRPRSGSIQQGAQQTQAG